MLVIFLAFASIFVSSPSYAQTKAEYDAIVAAAEAKVELASEALSNAQNALAQAQQNQNTFSNQITQAQLDLALLQTDIIQKANDLEAAQMAVDQAQANYDNNLIPVYPENVEPIIPGLQADIYTFDPQYYYPNRSTTEHTYCKTITVTHIDRDWGGGDIEGCGGDFVMIHYTGFLTVPTTGDYQFLAQVDDGWYMSLDDMVINDNWVLKGCGGWWSQPTQLQAGHSYRLDAWMYEYGGGACNQLLYLDTQNWGIVPASWFSQNQNQVTYIKDPALFLILEQAKANLLVAQTAYTTTQESISAKAVLIGQLETSKSQNTVIIETAFNDVTTKEEELRVAQQELEAIPPFKEPTPSPSPSEEPTKEPTDSKPDKTPITPTPTETNKPELPVDITTVNPQELTTTQVEELKEVANEILNNSEQGSPEYKEALDALFVAAQADDIVLPEELAAIPGAEALIGAINFMGNVGADMSPKVREESKKVVVTAVVAVGAAVNAATGAALMAAPAGGTSNTIRRNT